MTVMAGAIKYDTFFREHDWRLDHASFVGGCARINSSLKPVVISIKLSIVG
jgi:hypothetical protein